jgi:hypothetical protein
MSLMGQNQTFCLPVFMSVPPKADIAVALSNVRYVPKADVS